VRGLRGRKAGALPLYRTPEMLAALRDPDGDTTPTVIVCEGERATDAAVRLGFVAVGTVTGASCCPDDGPLRAFEGSRPLLWPDADPPGRAHMARLAERLRAMGIAVAGFIVVPGAEPGDDAADFRGTRDAALALVRPALTDEPPRAELVEPVPFFDGATFADAVLPVREVLATTSDGAALFHRRMTVAIAAHPGVGKTLALGSLAVSASQGEESLGIKWPTRRKTLLLDLELPGAEMQARYVAELRGRPGSDCLRIVSSDSLDQPLGALHSPGEMARLLPLYEWADIVVVDSGTYGLPTEDDNSAAAFRPCEDFLLWLRRQDKLVFVSWHLNASGAKIRGTTAKTQAADLVALLHHPPDSQHQGAHFAWTWTKRRGVTSDVAKDFEARLDADGWHLFTLDEHERRGTLLGLLRAGMPVGEAAEESGLSRATAYRWRSEMIDTGLIGKPPGWDKRQGRARS
jgi:AAA domain/Helix-turn-helix domain